MAIFYSLVFLGTGVSLPYAAVWFKARGLTGAEISLIYALPMLARIVTGPAAALWADRFAYRRTPMACLLVAASVAYGGLMAGAGLPFWTIAWFVASTSVAVVIPLADVLTLRRARQEGFAYGRPRGVGSLAFIAANVAGGALLARARPEFIFVWLSCLSAAGALFAWRFLPPEPVHAGGAPPSQHGRLSGVGALARNRAFLMAIVAGGLIQASHAFYYGFSTLLWREQNHSSAIIGLLWAFGVAAEIVFLWFFEPVRRRLGPQRLLVIGGAGALARWAAMALNPPLWALWPLQALHVLSFAATFTATLQLVDRLAPPSMVSLAQTLSSALSAGLLIGLATLASGFLYDHFAQAGYWPMAGLAAAGAALAIRLAPVLAERD